LLRPRLDLAGLNATGHLIRKTSKAGMSGGLGGFFDMGGYGAFVWPAYALVAALLVWLLISRIGRLKRRENELARMEQERQAGRGAPAAKDRA
jgi:heme exporter protein D